jgi:hypothetical protein
MLALGLATVGAPAASGESATQAFAGSAVGSLTFPSGTECQNYEGQNVRTDGLASGMSSLLGPMTLETSHCTPEGPEMAGEAQFVSESGDAVYIEYAASNAPPDPGTGVIISPGDFVVVGGSGRFEGAVGQGTLTAFVLFEGFEDPEWRAAWAWDGTIDY